MRNTTLCYVEQDGKYLMLHRIKKKHDINHHKWIGIGGKFEAHESPEDCLLREAKEETGLTLTRWRYRGIVTFDCDLQETEYMHLFTADGFTGKLKPCDEGHLEWVDKKKVLQLPIWEGDKIFLRLLAQDVPFFSLKLVYEGDTLTQAVLDGVPITPDYCPSPKTKEPLLISACLLGTACRYDGQAKTYPGLSRLKERYHLIPICPEQLGGLPTPRPPAERQGERVVTEKGTDVTAQYARGAEEALRLAKIMGCTKVLLKERSPSCGSGQVYDGTFSRSLTDGMGMTAELLEKNGFFVLGESQLAEL